MQIVEPLRGFPPGPIAGIIGHAQPLPPQGHSPQAHDNYRVILKHHGIDVEIGSIGIQHGSAGAVFWTWAIDTVVPMRDIGAHGRGADREDCMKQFRAAWERFSADRCLQFLETKRKRLKE